MTTQATRPPDIADIRKQLGLAAQHLTAANGELRADRCISQIIYALTFTLEALWSAFPPVTPSSAQAPQEGTEDERTRN